MFTIYSADVTGNPGNCSYPHKHVILDEDSLKATICHDYVCAEYRNSYGVTTIGDENEWDLCPECAKSLMDWLSKNKGR